VSRRVEWSAKDWDARPASLRTVRVHHGCGADHDSAGDPQDCGHVFVCRAPGGRFACGRYVGSCLGGGDNRCADCANKAWADLKRRIVAFVKSAETSRGEIAICQRFGRSEEHAPTEDALHELVQEKKLFWFGSSEKPLRYVTYSRRRWAMRSERHAKKLEVEKEERAQDRRFARERRSSEAA
jgi:hypothetical protein